MNNSLLANSAAFIAVFINAHCPCSINQQIKKCGWHESRINLRLVASSIYEVALLNHFGESDIT